jgi:hypothetical protein
LNSSAAFVASAAETYVYLGFTRFTQVAPCVKRQERGLTQVSNAR